MLDLRNLLTEMSTVLKDLKQLDTRFDGKANGSMKTDSFTHSLSATNKQRISSGYGMTSSPSTTFGSYGAAGGMLADIQWMVNLPFELDLLISERRFDSAVDLVDKVRDLQRMHPKLETAVSSHALQEEIEQRVSHLADTLAAELQTPTLKPAHSRSCIARMIRLGLADKAKAIFLETRSRRIRTEIRKLKFEGDIALYISELSKLVFSSISMTCDEYRHSFPDTKMISGFVVWAMHELQTFGEMFQRQVFNTDDFQIMGQCLQIAEYHCKMLEQKGLSLAFQFWQQILPGIAELVNTYNTKIASGIAKQIGEEQWLAKSQWIYYDNDRNQSESRSATLYLTSSAIFLNTTVQRFANDICCILHTEQVPVACAAFSQIFELYLGYLSENILASTSLDDKQQLAILADASFVVEDFAARISRQLQERLNRPVRELDRMCKKLEGRYSSLRDAYCIHKAKDILSSKDKMDWDHADFSLENLGSSDATPSAKFTKLVSHLGNVALSISTTIGPDSTAPIIGRIVVELATGMGGGEMWEKIGNGSLKIGYGGLQQLVLDCKYFMVATTKYLNDDALEAIRGIIERAVIAYCDVSKQDPRTVLKKESWFQNAVQNAIVTSSLS